MKVKEAIEQLKKLPPDARILVADLGTGGLEDVKGFEVFTEGIIEVVWDTIQEKAINENL